jgi:hypothetical protein
MTQEWIMATIEPLASEPRIQATNPPHAKATRAPDPSTGKRGATINKAQIMN